MRSRSFLSSIIILCWAVIASIPAVLKAQDSLNICTAERLLFRSAALDVALQNHFAIVADGSGLSVFDIADSTAPALCATTDLSATAVTVVGNLAYAVGNTLQIWNVSDPTVPVLLGTAPFGGTGIAVVAQRAYVSNVENAVALRIFDVSNPNMPLLLGTCGAPGAGQSVAVIDTLAFLACQMQGIRAIDISDPANPIEVGSYITPSYAYGVAVKDSLVYVADGFAGLFILRFADLHVPQVVGQVIAGGNWERFNCAVKIVGNQAVMASSSAGVRIINISNPASAYLAGTFDTPGMAQQAIARGTNLFVADFLEGLRVANISSPLNSVEIGAVHWPLPPTAVECHDDTAYVANVYGGLTSVACSDPGGMHVVGYGAQPPLTGSPTPLHLAVAGNLVTIAEGSRFVVFNISNPAQPQYVTCVDSITSNAFAVAMHGQYAFVTYYSSNLLSVYDLMNPANPIEVASIDLGGTNGMGLDVQDTLLVAVGSWGFRILNIRNPVTPQLLGFCNTNGEIWYDVAVHSNYAYVAGYTDGLKIVDISDPNAPQIASALPLPGVSRFIDWKDGYVVVANDNGTRVIDVTNPLSPVETGHYPPTFEFALGVCFTTQSRLLVCSSPFVNLLDPAASMFRPPANVQASEESCDSVILTWTNVSLGGSIEIKRDSILLATIPASAETYVDLTPQGRHQYSVRLVSACGEGPSAADAGGIDEPLILSFQIAPQDTVECGDTARLIVDLCSRVDSLNLALWIDSVVVSRWRLMGVSDTISIAMPTTEYQYSQGWFHLVSYHHNLSDEERTAEFVLHCPDASTPMTRADVPFDYFLEQNYPNPFNSTTRIRFGIPVTDNVTVEVFDVLGRKLDLLTKETYSPGMHEVIWDCAACPSGMYLIRMQVGDRKIMIKSLMLK